ncbi:MAG: MerC family mercury resistance protein [candidate division NC10 bacterium]|nr:MerC family mercury resistance protein [candidate division NC10 bacterium]
MSVKDVGSGGTLLGAAGGFGSVLSATAGLGCCAGAFAPAVTAVSAATLGVFDQSRVQLPFLYFALALSLIGLAVSYRRHRRPWALLLAGAATAILLIPFHVALDVTLFQQMFSVGILGLVLASGCDALCIWRVRRTACGKPVPAAAAADASDGQQ